MLVFLSDRRTSRVTDGKIKMQDSFHHPITDVSLLQTGC